MSQHYQGDAFPNLPHAPITEAVLELRGRARSKMDHEEIQKILNSTLPEYEVSKVHQRLEIGFSEDQPPIKQDLGYQGVRVNSKDKLEFCRFEKDTFAYSRLAPYLGWEEFEAKALQFWGLHRQIADPGEVVQIGLRFINRIPTKNLSEVNQILERFPQPPDLLNLPLASFLNHHTFLAGEVGGRVNLITTIQPNSTSGHPVLIVDIDVISMESWNGQIEALRTRLAQMRVLKNRTFFGSLTQSTIDRFL